MSPGLKLRGLGGRIVFNSINPHSPGILTKPRIAAFSRRRSGDTHAEVTVNYFVPLFQILDDPF